MTKASIKFLKIPNYTVEDLQSRRLGDWHESGTHLGEKLEKYDEDYRVKICSKCDDAQKKVRSCFTFPAFDSNGNLKRRCGHMVRAQSQKFRKQIYAHIGLHPAFYNPDN